MKLSAFGQKFSGDSGIVELMDDLSTALRDNPDMIFMGGGNPGRVPEVETAFQHRLEAILAELEAEETDLDRLAERVKRASELVRHCRAKIHGAELEVEKVLKELPAQAEARDEAATDDGQDPPF